MNIAGSMFLNESTFASPANSYPETRGSDIRRYPVRSESSGSKQGTLYIFPTAPGTVSPTGDPNPANPDPKWGYRRLAAFTITDDAALSVWDWYAPGVGYNASDFNGGASCAQIHPDTTPLPTPVYTTSQGYIHYGTYGGTGSIALTRYFGDPVTNPDGSNARRYSWIGSYMTPRPLFALGLGPGNVAVTNESGPSFRVLPFSPTASPGPILTGDIERTTNFVFGAGVNAADRADLGYSLATTFRLNAGEWQAFDNSSGAAKVFTQANGVVWGWNLFELRASDSFGGEAVTWARIYIFRPPVAAFTWSDRYVASSKSDDIGKIDYDASGSQAFQGRAVNQYEWNFGVTTTDTKVTREYGVSEEERTIGVALRVRDTAQIWSSLVTQQVKISPYIGGQCAAVALPGGELVTAATIGTNPSTKTVEVARWLAPGQRAVAFAPSGRECPSLWLGRRGGQWCGSIFLSIRGGFGGWELYRSRNSGRTWQNMNVAIFTDTQVKFAHVVGTPGGGAVAIGVKIGSQASSNQVLVKTTTNPLSWPADSESKVVKTGVERDPWRLELDIDGKNTLTATNGKTDWIRSRDWFKTWE